MTDTRVAFVHGRRVWDSRGRPTIEADLLLEGGAVGRGMAPAGASTGAGEALDLRDGGDGFGGYDVTRALGYVNTQIARALVGMDAADQAALDGRLIELDGTPSKSRLGANALIAVSMAAAHAAAAAAGEPLYRYLGGADAVTLPLPQIQIFGGGAHAGRRVDVQDFLVTCPGAASFAQALDWTAEIYRAAGALMAEAGQLAGVADEGGWWPAFKSNEAALEMLVRAIQRAGFKAPADVAIALDVAASEFGRGGKYRLALEGRELDSEGMIKLLSGWVRAYPIVSIEDPLSEDDDVGFAAFTTELGSRVQVVGDDFLVSQASRVREAALRGTVNAVLLKPKSARHPDRDAPSLGGGAGERDGGDRLGPVGRDRGHDDRASRRGLGRGPDQGRQLRARRADGEVERGVADRGGVERPGAVRRQGRARPVETVMNVVFHYAAGPDLAARLAAVAGEGLAIEVCAEHDDTRFAALLPEMDVLWHALRPVTGGDDRGRAPPAADPEDRSGGQHHRSGGGATAGDRRLQPAGDERARRGRADARADAGRLASDSNVRCLDAPR